ncbi:MAG TPA: polysaccharide deacetylase family protein [Gemmatimonadales bacterium]
MRLITLEYHDVVAPGDFDGSGFPGPDAASYKMARPDFEAHLRALDAAYGGPRGRVDSLPSGGASVPVALTFDDGGRTALDPTAELLERHGWRGHFFMATDYIGTPGFMTERHLRELAGRGHVVGTHSCTHPLRMSSCPPAQIDREWRDSVARLAEILGAPVTVASVPGGGYSRAVASAAAAAGIRHLFTSEPVVRAHVVDGCTVLGRYTLRRDSPAALAAALAAGDAAPRAAQWVSWNSRKALKRVAGPAYLALRQWMYSRGSSSVQAG